jgi:hypothetical protein
VQLELIGDSGNRVRANLTRAQQSVFRGTLNLAQGEWTMVVKVKTTSQELEGQHILGVGRAVTDGRFALTPPNPEVGRLSWLVGCCWGYRLAWDCWLGLWRCCKMPCAAVPKKSAVNFRTQYQPSERFCQTAKASRACCS